jgi:MOSC domain-containing protein YiiM
MQSILIQTTPMGWKMPETTVENAIPKVTAINVSTKKGVPKKTIQIGEFITNFGLKDDAHAGDWHRQVSFLGQESIDRMTTQGIKGLGPGKFAENITTQNIVLYELSIGDRLIIGETVFEVTQIGKKCHQKCAIYHQIGDCVMPNEGIFARVLHGGIIRPGEKISVERGIYTNLHSPI